MENKKVSIVVCTYNGEKYLREQIDSLLAQTYPIYEIIIQDDCSTDSTWAIVEEYIEKYPQLIKGIRNCNTLGWNQNFYAAIMETTGDYIACCDQDDYWLPNKIEYQMSHIGDKYLHICSSYIWKNEILIPRPNSEMSLEQMCFIFRYAGHQCLLNKNFKEYISMGQKIDMSHDRFLSLVAKYIDSIVISDELLVYWRRHDSNTTGDLIIKKHSGFYKVCYTLYQLLVKRKKSIVIQNACNKYFCLFEYMNMQYGEIIHSKKIMLMWKLLKEQTVLGYIRVSFIMWEMRKEMNIFSNNIDLKTIYNVFTYPFRWWYIHKEDL